MSNTGKRKSQKFEAANQRKSLSKLDAAKRAITEKEILKLFDTNDGSLEFNEKKLGDQGCSFIGIYIFFPDFNFFSWINLLHSIPMLLS